MYKKMRKRNSKFQYGIKAERKNVVKERTILKKINDCLKVKTNFKNIINKIKSFVSSAVIVVVLYIFSLFVISSFSDGSNNAIFDFQFILVIQAITLIPIFVVESNRNKESHKIKKRRFELYVFVLDSLLLVILGYLIVFSEMAEKTKMVKTILTESNNILKLIVLLLTPIKIYYSIKSFQYSRDENARK